MSTAPQNAFSFDGYTVRAATEQDRPYLEQWIDADPYHRDRLTADYFLKLAPGEESYALEEPSGQVALYFKTATAVRLSIQFGPGVTTRDRRANRVALLKGLRWIEGILRAHFYREILFDSEGRDLRQFSENHLGFKEASVMTKMLNTTTQPPRMPPEAVGTAPTEGERVG
jgi:hypothetical protein